ncbi:arrestin domain-containing protein 17-like [Manduca sexta]|uniref:arrestin domain-containing protein 17-like n=1 Tax=Manduca sexta TaxID=7130 RepID=UPI00189015AC|nr:arrestin domain-containing protein 17-like [Manduca sexta]
MGVLCQILIDRPFDGVHRAGGPVTGVVKYALDQPKEYKDIILALRGESWCHWSESDTDNETYNYTGKESHVCEEVSLLNPTHRTRTLPAGAYEHRFLFTLPKIIPPSFKTRTGHVCYKILLEFKKDAVFNATKSFKAEITVRNHLDATLLDTPTVFGADHKLFKPMSFGKQEVYLKGEIATPYIIPGDRAHLKLMITNDSTVHVKCLRAELVRCTIYTADGGRTANREKKIKNCMVETAEVRPRSKAEMAVTVPTLELERTVQHSKVISNEYKILVTAVLPVPHRNVTVMVPILLGDRACSRHER